MKRHRNLYPQVTDFANLLAAAKAAQRGKRFRASVLAFNANLENEILLLQDQLISKTYQPGPYYTFQIYEPKPRLISAAPYRDRVVHHALCNIITPIFEKTFISDSYANRTGYGTHRALRRFKHFASISAYVLQCDIRKYFPSIDHDILKTLIRRKVKCPHTLWLIDTIIDNSNAQESVLHYFPGDDLLTPTLRPHGLPIGNLTSQLFANIYLNSLDHFIKQTLQIRRYLRYADDFALFSDHHSELATARLAIEDHLATLRLIMHPIKSQLFATRKGSSFVGFRLIPHGSTFPKSIQIRVRSSSLKRSCYRLRCRLRAFHQGFISLQQLCGSLQSWQAHLQHGDTYRLRLKILNTLRHTV